MRIVRLRRPLCIAAMWAMLGCSPQPADEACDHYKAALLKSYECDRLVPPPPVNGTYDAYQCVSGDVDGGAASEVLEACTMYLNSLGRDGGCVVVLNQRERCKRGLLRLRDDGPDGGVKLPAQGVGTKCELQAPVNGISGETYTEVQTPACPGPAGACVVDCRASDSPCDTAAKVSAHAYCSCVCDFTDDSLPGCACPSGYACVSMAGPEGGFCLKD